MFGSGFVHEISFFRANNQVKTCCFFFISELKTYPPADAKQTFKLEWPYIQEQNKFIQSKQVFKLDTLTCFTYVQTDRDKQ